MKNIKVNPFAAVGIILGIALLVFLFLHYNGKVLLAIGSFFERPEPYKTEMVLFVGDGCHACSKVDDFLKNNKGREKLAITELEVFNHEGNSNILADKVQICGLDIDKVGVPFLWDGIPKKCVYGYADVITYLTGKLKAIK
jgi:hypothetical protein